MLEQYETETPLVASIEGDAWTDGLHAATLICLGDRSSPTPLADLARQLRTFAEAGNDADRLEVHLHHVVLPKLAEAGFVSYDTEACVAEAGEQLS